MFLPANSQKDDQAEGRKLEKEEEHRITLRQGGQWVLESAQSFLPQRG